MRTTWPVPASARCEEALPSLNGPHTKSPTPWLSRLLADWLVSRRLLCVPFRPAILESPTGPFSCFVLCSPLPRNHSAPPPPPDTSITRVLLSVFRPTDGTGWARQPGRRQAGKCHWPNRKSQTSFSSVYGCVRSILCHICYRCSVSVATVDDATTTDDDDHICLLPLLLILMWSYRLFLLPPKSSRSYLTRIQLTVGRVSLPVECLWRAASSQCVVSCCCYSSY